MAPDLGKMVGPLPLGAWLAVVGGGLGFALYSRRQSAAAAPAAGTVDDTSGVPGVGDGSVGGWQSTSPTDSQNTGGGSVAPPITDNDSWGRAAEVWAIGHGYPPLAVDTAVRAYLSGDDPGVQGSAIISAILAGIGPPPTPLPAATYPPSSPTPTPAPTPVPSPIPRHNPIPVPRLRPRAHPVASHMNVRYYTVARGDTLSRIGQRFHVPWQHIYAANRAGVKRADGSRGFVVSPNIIRPGWRLVIPAS